MKIKYALIPFLFVLCWIFSGCGKTEELLAENNRLAEKVVKIEEQKSSVAERLAVVETENRQHEHRVAQLEAENGGLAESIAELETRNGRLMESVALLEAENQQLNERIANIERENVLMAEKNESLKSELDDLRYGAKTLLDEAKMLFENKEFKVAIEKIRELEERHPLSPELKAAKELADRASNEIARSERERERILNESLVGMERRYDPMQGITWFTPPTPSWDDLIGKGEFHMGIYVGKHDEGQILPRLTWKSMVTGGHIRPTELIMRVGDHRVTLPIRPASVNAQQVTHRSYGRIFFEEWDGFLSEENMDFFSRIANSNLPVMIRLEGRHNHRDVVLNDGHRADLKRAYNAYLALLEDAQRK